MILFFSKLYIYIPTYIYVSTHDFVVVATTSVPNILMTKVCTKIISHLVPIAENLQTLAVVDIRDAYQTGL